MGAQVTGISGKGSFPSTAWSIVRAGGSGDVKALNRLLQDYRPGVINAIRRLRQDAPDRTAEDVCQDFLALMATGTLLASAREDQGKFRAFLVTCLRRFVISDLRKASAQKRGGGASHESFEELGDQDGGVESWERHWDEEWATTILALAAQAVRGAWIDKGWEESFDRLFPKVMEATPETYDDLATVLGLPSGTSGRRLNDLKKEYRTALRHEVVRTTASWEDVEQEFDALKAILRRRQL